MTFNRLGVLNRFWLTMLSTYMGLSGRNTIVSQGASIYSYLGWSYANKAKFAKNYNSHWGRLAQKTNERWAASMLHGEEKP